MLRNLERPAGAARRFATDVGPVYLANGFIGFLFATTGPLAIILATGMQGGLSQAEIASWVFGAFVLNGLITLADVLAGTACRSASSGPSRARCWWARRWRT